MSRPSLRVETDPPLVLTDTREHRPGLHYPLIVGIGAIRRPAGGEETGNVSVVLDNAAGTASRLFAVPPLRAAATLYGPSGEVWFSGVLASVTLAETASLALEA